MTWNALSMITIETEHYRQGITWLILMTGKPIQACEINEHDGEVIFDN